MTSEERKYLFRAANVWCSVRSIVLLPLVAVVEDSVFSLGVLKYVICLCKGCDGCYLFVL